MSLGNCDLVSWCVSELLGLSEFISQCDDLCSTPLNL